MKNPLLKNVLEKDVEQVIVEWLRIHKFHYAVNPTRSLYSQKGGRFKRFDGTPGPPDIVVVVNSLYVGLELKRPGGDPRKKQSPNQKEFQQDLEKVGGGYYQLVICVEDIEWLLELREKTEQLFGIVQETMNFIPV